MGPRRLDLQDVVRPHLPSLTTPPHPTPPSRSRACRYRCGNAQCYATSPDAIRWTKPLLPELGHTNIVDDKNFDGSTIWLDLRPGVPADARYKMSVVCEESCSHYTIKYSADGLKWRTTLNESGPTVSCATSQTLLPPSICARVLTVRPGNHLLQPLPR